MKENSPFTGFTELVLMRYIARKIDSIYWLYVNETDLFDWIMMHAVRFGFERITDKIVLLILVNNQDTSQLVYYIPNFLCKSITREGLTGNVLGFWTQTAVCWKIDSTAAYHTYLLPTITSRKLQHKRGTLPTWYYPSNPDIFFHRNAIPSENWHKKKYYLLATLSEVLYCYLKNFNPVRRILEPIMLI